jgi:holo-[acyl-carrier protein] synthase
MGLVAIGVDLAEVDRIEELINRYGNRFLKRVFTQDEIDYCDPKVTATSSYAARFAAKEAVLKATGLGLDKGLNWKDIEVINDANGKPSVKLYGQTNEKLLDKKIHISLSHTKNLAIAMVAVEDCK